MEIKLHGGSKTLNLDACKCSELGRLRGLMFRSREKANALVFSFRKPTRTSIHSYFVFFPFVAVWLDEKNNILEKKVVASFKIRVCPQNSYSKLVEIPINRRYSRVINFLEGI